MRDAPQAGLNTAKICLTLGNACILLIAALTYREYTNPTLEDWKTLLLVQLWFSVVGTYLAKLAYRKSLVYLMAPVASSLMLSYEQDNYVVFAPTLLLATVFFNALPILTY